MDRSHRVKNHRRKELKIEGISPELRTALVSGAREANLSVNEVAVRILADHYKVKVLPAETGLRGPKDSRHSFVRSEDTDKFSIRGPAKLHRAIASDARRRKGTLRGVVLERLAIHFQLPAEPIGRRPRQKEKA